MTQEQQIRELRIMGAKHLKDRITFLEVNMELLGIKQEIIIRNKAEKVRLDNFIKDHYGISLR